MTTRVRLPPGMLQEVDVDKRKAGIAMREPWPANPPSYGPPCGMQQAYIPGSLKSLVADDIEAMLLPGDTKGPSGGAKDSLIESLLQKAASSVADFNSVPWSTSDDSLSRDYLANVMSLMNRDVTIGDQMDADIEQIINDPDAFVARTGSASAPTAGPGQTAAVSQQRVLSSGPTPVDLKAARTRKLVQGTSFRAAQDVGRFDVSGTPRHPVQSALPGEPLASSCPPRPDTQMLAGSTAQHGSAHVGEAMRASSNSPKGTAEGQHAEISLQEIVDAKQTQAQEMKALCDRLQSLVSAAKDLAKPSSAPELPKTTNSTDLLPPATLPSAPVLGKGEQQSRASGVTVRAQQRAQLIATEESTQRALGGAAKAVTPASAAALLRDGELEHGAGGRAAREREKPGVSSSQWRVQDADLSTDEGTCGVDGHDLGERRMPSAAALSEGTAASKVPVKNGKALAGALKRSTSGEGPGVLKRTPSVESLPRSPISFARSPPRTPLSFGPDVAYSGSKPPTSDPSGGGGTEEGGGEERSETPMKDKKADASKSLRPSSARKKFATAVHNIQSMDKVVKQMKGPACKGRKVSVMAGHKKDGEETSLEMLRSMMSKLAGSWKSVGAMFNHFDRPEVELDGKHQGDKEISEDEFMRGVKALDLDFTDEQIEQMFHLVDIDGSGFIDHSELETVLRDCGVLKSIAVKRVPKSVFTMAREKEEQAIEQEVAAEQQKKKGKKKGAGQPIDPPGMSAQVAEGLLALEDRVEALRKLIQEVTALGHQFDIVSEQYSKATGADAQADQTRMSLLEAGESLCAHMADGIKEYKERAEEVHEYSVELIRDLPRDYRVVWKAAVCGEIDEKGGLVRVLNEEMYECQEVLVQMQEQCREWRLHAKQPALDFTVPKEADGNIAQLEKFAQVMGKSRDWIKTAVSRGFVDERKVHRKLDAAPDDDSDMIASCLAATASLAEKLHPYVQEGQERIAARMEMGARARAQRAEQPKTAAPQDKNTSMRSSHQGVNVSVNASSAQSKVLEWRGGGLVGGAQVDADNRSLFGGDLLNMSAASRQLKQSVPSQQRPSSQLKASGHGGLNYDELHEQVQLAQQLRAQLASEDALEQWTLDSSTLSACPETSLQAEVGQLVRSRIQQVSRHVKETVAAAPTAQTAVSPNQVAKASKPGAGLVRGNPRGASAAASGGRGDGREKHAAAAPAKERRVGARANNVWDKLDAKIAADRRRLAQPASGADTSASASAPSEVGGGRAGGTTGAGIKGLVRRTTKPPADRAGLPRGLNTLSRQHVTGRMEHGEDGLSRGKERLETRIGAGRGDPVMPIILPTGSCTLLVRAQPSKGDDKEAEKGEEEGGRRLAGGSKEAALPRVAAILSPGPGPLREGMPAGDLIASGVFLEFQQSAVSWWTAVTADNAVRELAAILHLPASDLHLEGQSSRLAPNSVEVELLHTRQWAGVVAQSMSAQAADPSSSLWTLTHLVKMEVDGMIYEKADLQGSPPREDLVQEAVPDGASPQLTSAVWEEVKAPMLREHTRTHDIEDDADRAKDAQPRARPFPDAKTGAPAALSDLDSIESSAPPHAGSRRSLDFHEVVEVDKGAGSRAEDSFMPLPQIKHRKPRVSARVVETQSLQPDEHALTARVLNYLSHHMLARLETESRLHLQGIWCEDRREAEKDGDDETLQGLARMRREANSAGGCSPFAASLLGIDGLMLLIQSGVDVKDDDILELAEDSIMEEARRAFRRERGGGPEGAAEVDLGASDPDLEPLVQPRSGHRPTVLRESTRPFTLNRRVKEDDEATQSLILRLLLELMGEGLDDDDPARQAALDAETHEQLRVAHMREEMRQQQLAAEAEARRWQIDNETRSSVASFISQDGAQDPPAEDADEANTNKALAPEDPHATPSDGVERPSEVGVAAVHHVVPADDQPLHLHQQRVESTLTRIADSMDALTSLTLKLASAAGRPPELSPAVGALQAQTIAGRPRARTSPAGSLSPSALSDPISESVASGVLTYSPPGAAYPSSEESLASAIIEADFTPPKTSMDSDHQWTPVQRCIDIDQGAQTVLDFELPAAAAAASPGWQRDWARVQNATHSAQTSMDLDVIFPNLRTRMRGNTEASDKELQTSFDFDHSPARPPSAFSSVSRDVDASEPSRNKLATSSSKATALQATASAGLTSALSEPLAHSLISTLQSVAEEVARLREARVAPTPPSAVPERAGGEEREAVGKGYTASAAHSGISPYTSSAPASPLVGAARQVSGAGISIVDASTQAQSAPSSPAPNLHADADREASAVEVTAGEQTGSSSSPDVSSTSMSEGEWRDPNSLLTLETSLIAPASPPHKPSPSAEWSQKDAVSAIHGHGYEQGQASSRRTSLAGRTTHAQILSTLVSHHPWREGGVALRTFAEVPQSQTSQLPSVGSRAERRAERQARRAAAALRLRQSMEGVRESVESAGSLMGTMCSTDDMASAATRTDSELSDGEVASSVVWWLEGSGGVRSAGDDGCQQGEGERDSEVSDGELRHSS